MPPGLVALRGHDWLAGKAFLTAVRPTYRLCDSREPIKKAMKWPFMLVRGVCGPARGGSWEMRR